MPEPENLPDPLKDIRPKMKTVADFIYETHKNIAPILEQAQKSKEAFEKIAKPINDSIETVKLFSKRAAEEKERMENSSRIVPYHFGIRPMPEIAYVPQRVQLDPADRKLLEEIRDQKKVTSVKNSSDLLYDWKEKILSRTIPSKVLTSRFIGGEAKRVNFFERLLRAQKYVATEDLRDELGCPTNDAVRKLAQGINNKFKEDLALKKLFVIQGKPNSGYRINPEVTIHRA